MSISDIEVTPLGNGQVRVRFTASAPGRAALVNYGPDNQNYTQARAGLVQGSTFQADVPVSGAALWFQCEVDGDNSGDRRVDDGDVITPTVTPAANSVRVEWTTLGITLGKVDYWIDPASPDQEVDPTSGTSHSVDLTGLQAGTQYQFRTLSEPDNSAQEYEYIYCTADSSFTTHAQPVAGTPDPTDHIIATPASHMAKVGQSVDIQVQCQSAAGNPKSGVNLHACLATLSLGRGNLIPANAATDAGGQVKFTFTASGVIIPWLNHLPAVIHIYTDLGASQRPMGFAVVRVDK